MFHTARLKLTAWYLVIITLIMMVFSMAIYQVTTLELERGLRRFQNHFVNGELGAVPPRFPRQEVNNQVIENLELAKHLILIRLLTIDGVILLLSAVAGYFLAGKTLKPIERSLKEQKRFVADASHELKTPLTALKTSTEVTLRSKKLSLAKAKQALESNLEEIESLSHLSNDLLRLTKLQSNGELINKKTFKLKKLIQEDVDCIIVAAGMEGALATLVSTMVDIPIIGIPTSVGYGYGEKGIAALASMLQSCSLGLSVVNIDNGIAAGGIAANIANRVNKKMIS